MKRTKAEADVTRQQLLESALRVFSEKGYAATRLSDIAVAAGVTRGAIYHHFGNKKELFIALFKDRADPYFQVVSEILSTESSPLEKIRQLMKTMMQNFEEDERFQADERLRMRHSSPLTEISEIKDILFENIKRTLILAEQMVQAGQKAGEIRNDLDARDIVVFLFSLIRGVACILEGGLLKKSVVGKAEIMTELFFEGVKS